MKKKLLSVMVAALATLSGLQASAQATEAYAVIDGSTLTFYYDAQRASHQGTTYTVPQKSAWDDLPGWVDNEQIQTAVFDASYAGFEPIKMESFFQGLSNLTSVTGLENVNSANVTNMSNMFSGCASLETLDLTGLNTENVTNMANMFSGCSSLKSMDLSILNTGKVSDIGYMFEDCSALETVNLVNLSTDSLTTAYWMFKGCSQLKTIYCNDDWSATGHEINGFKMFRGCKNLVGAVPFDSAKIGIEMANPTQGYFTSKVPTAINDITTTQAQGAQTRTYNLNGQLVGDSYKGIVIKNGKKVMQQ